MTIRLRPPRLRAPRLESLVLAAFALFGFALGLRPIGDASMLTHLRTGIDMIAGGGIPRSDPYSFTAFGDSWVVQSWLPDWTYGWAHRLGGSRLVLLEQALLIALLVWLVVRLARAGSPLRTAFGGLLVVGIGACFWTPGPFLVGLLCMALTVTVVERRRTPWLLVPIVWLWVSSHGSFPLGLAWLGARAVGEALDWRAWPRDAMRYAAGFAAGLVVAALNPLGLRLLLFPFSVAARQEAVHDVVEWMSPDFQRSPARIALVLLTVVVVLLFRARLTWRDVVPAAVFVAAGLLAVRNLPVAAVVLAPVVGRVLKRPDYQPPLPPPTPAARRLNMVLAGMIAVAAVLGLLSLRSTAPLDLGGYPVAAVAFLDEAHLLVDPNRLASTDAVGTYLELRFGAHKPPVVFIDERYEMFPAPVIRDYQRLLSASPETNAVLERWKVNVVLWERRLPLTAVLKGSGQWREIYGDERWVVLTRSGLPAGEAGQPAGSSGQPSGSSGQPAGDSGRPAARRASVGNS